MVPSGRRAVSVSRERKDTARRVRHGRQGFEFDDDGTDDDDIVKFSCLGEMQNLFKYLN